MSTTKEKLPIMSTTKEKLQRELAERELAERAIKQEFAQLLHAFDCLNKHYFTYFLTGILGAAFWFIILAIIN